MQFSLLLMVSCVVSYLVAAAPEHRSSSLHNTASLEHSKRDPNLLKFIHKLLHTLENDYQDPNWPRNLQQRTQPTLSDDCTEEENRSVEDECNDDREKILDRVYAHNEFDGNPDHVFEEVYESYEKDKPSTKLQKAMREPYERNRKENVDEKSSKFVITNSGLENRKPKLVTNLQKTYPVTTQVKSEERRALQELLHKRLSDFHLPRIQINQFGTNKVEQNLYHQPKGLGSMNKNHREEMQKKFRANTNIDYEQPHKVGSRKFSDSDEEYEGQRNHQVGNIERTWPIESRQNTQKKSHSKQNPSESKGHRGHDSSPIVSATQSSIQYSDVDINIGRNTDIQDKIYEQVNQFNIPEVRDQLKTAKQFKVAESIVVGHPKVTHPPIVPDQPEVSNYNHPKLADQPKVPDQLKTAKQSKVADQSIVFGHPKLTHPPKVPDQPEESKYDHPKLADQPKVPDQHKTAKQSKVADQSIVVGHPKVTHPPKVPDLPKVSDHPKLADQPKVPDQPKIIIDDTTKATTKHTINFRFTTADDVSTETNLLGKKTTETEKSVTPAIDITTLPAIDDSKKIGFEDESSERSKRTKDTARGESIRNIAGAVTPTRGTPRDQEAEGTRYYPLNLNEHGYDRSPLKFIHIPARHGVPIAYELYPRKSASHFYSNYYNPGIQNPLQQIAKSPTSTFSRDRFATIQHEIDYDDYGDYGTQSSYPTQYHLNTPAATEYWSSIYRPRHGTSVRNSLDSTYKYAKQSQSLFEHADFEDPELTAGWENWEPSYSNDMLHDRSYLRPALRDPYSLNQY